MRSTRSCSRARRNSESGYALIAAIVLSVLYFALVELLMIDSSRELAEARRFRARVIAQTLAENGAELAAIQLAKPERVSSTVNAEDWQGTMTGQMHKNASGEFDIEATGKTAGLVPIATKVVVRGRVVKLSPGVADIRIQYTIHTP